MVSLISRPILVLCLPIFHTTCSSPRVVIMHLFMSSYSPFTALLSRSSFMQVSKKVVSMEGSISLSGLSLLLEVEASVKLFLASMIVSRALQIKLRLLRWSFSNPCTVFGLFPLVISYCDSTSEHYIYVWILFTAQISSSVDSDLVKVVAPLCHVSLLSV